jgi:hypothetical protein
MKTDRKLDQQIVDGQRARFPASNPIAITARTQRLGPSRECSIEPGTAYGRRRASVGAAVGIGEVTHRFACGGGESVAATRNGIIERDVVHVR